MVTVTTIGQEPGCLVSDGVHRLEADTTVENGGQGAGFRPHDLLTAALGKLPGHPVADVRFAARDPVGAGQCQGGHRPLLRLTGQCSGKKSFSPGTASPTMTGTVGTRSAGPVRFKTPCPNSWHLSWLPARLVDGQAHHRNKVAPVAPASAWAGSRASRSGANGR